MSLINPCAPTRSGGAAVSQVIHLSAGFAESESSSDDILCTCIKGPAHAHSRDDYRPLDRSPICSANDGPSAVRYLNCR
jgi:hypothetical protein